MPMQLVKMVADQVAAMAISLPSRVTTLSQEPRD
jgi:hypothetical protein